MNMPASNRTQRIALVVTVWATILMGPPAGAGEPFEIAYQNDGINELKRDMPHFPRWQVVKGIDAAHFQAEVDKYADSGLKSISYGLWSGGNSFNHPTKVGRLFCEGIPDETMIAAGSPHLATKHALAEYVRKGIDPLGVIVKRAKERGMTITAELRANNVFMGGTLEKPSSCGPGYNGLIWYQHPEWRLTDPYPITMKDPYSGQTGTENPAWDYAKPEVRDFYLRVLTEVLDNYDVDGIDVDFAQNPPYFNRDEPDKIGHMTTFIKALRAECDRVGKQRGKHMLLTVIFRVSLYGRDHLRDDGIDVGNWAKQGLVDRIMVMAGSGSKYVKMVQGTKCKVYAGHGGKTHEQSANIEKGLREAGFDGVFYFNYWVRPDDRQEYRSLNADYRADVVPPLAPNRWQATQEPNARVLENKLHLEGEVNYWRQPPMLPMGGPGVTMEARINVLTATPPAFCGIRIADGRREATLGISGDQLILSDGEQTLKSARIDAKGRHTIRLTIDDKHLANAYLDGKNEPIMTVPLTRQTAEQIIMWGHLNAGSKTDPRSEWEAVHYTLEGAFRPGERAFQ